MKRETTKAAIRFWAPLIGGISLLTLAFAWWAPWTWAHWRHYDGGDRSRTIEWGEEHP